VPAVLRLSDPLQIFDASISTVKIDVVDDITLISARKKCRGDKAMNGFGDRFSASAECHDTVATGCNGRPKYATGVSLLRAVRLSHHSRQRPNAALVADLV